MSIDVATYGTMANVALHGSFGVKDVDAFKKVMALTTDQSLEAIHMDFKELQSIDDEGLGLLMLLRMRAKRNRKTVALHGAQGVVRQKFEQNRLLELFQRD